MAVLLRNCIFPSPEPGGHHSVVEVHSLTHSFVHPSIHYSFHKCFLEPPTLWAYEDMERDVTAASVLYGR